MWILLANTLFLSFCANTAVLGSKEENGKYRGELVTVCHNAKNKLEAQRIQSGHADTTRILEVCVQAHAGCCGSAHVCSAGLARAAKC